VSWAELFGAAENALLVYLEPGNVFSGCKCLFPAGKAISAPINPLAGLKEPLRRRGKIGGMEEWRETKGRTGTKRTKKLPSK